MVVKATEQNPIKQRARPPLKWAGGKGRLLQKITKRFPEKIGTYYEPFLGGGAVFFELASQKRFDRAVLGDKCPELMNLFHTIRNDVEGLISALKQPQYVYDRTAFLLARAVDPDDLSPAERSARTVYLNKTCFNGLYRVNGSGKFNTPFGKYTNPLICDEANLRACSEALKLAELCEGDFEDVCTDAGPGDVVYYDPPYMPISKTSKFTQYTSDGFSYEDHWRLSRLFKTLNDRGVTQVLSNSSSDDISSLFDGFQVEIIIGARSVGRPDKRESVPEILVNNCEFLEMAAQ